MGGGKKKNRGRRKAKKKASGVQKLSTKSVRFTDPIEAISPPTLYTSPDDESAAEIRPPSPPRRRNEKQTAREDLEEIETGRRGLSRLDIDEPKMERNDSTLIPWMNPGDEGLLTSLDALGHPNSHNNHSDSGKIPSPPLHPVIPFPQENHKHPFSTSVMELKSSKALSPPWGSADSTVTAVMTVEGPAGEGLNGAYIVRDEKGGKWIFKPNDEEGCRRDDEDDDRAVTVPNRDLVPGSSAELTVAGKVPLKQGVIWGETAKKEQAAYLLDHDHFAGVPMTFALHLVTPDKNGKPQFKFGSLQQWKENIGSCEDHGESVFPTEDVHKIGILDIRLLNLDRHMGNILVAKDKKRGGHQLVPIDHGFILPDFRNLSETSFEWLNFRQCKEPFSSETKHYITKLDIFADARRLKSLDIRDEAVLGSMTSTLLLKRGAQADLTLYDLGSMIQRRGIGDEKSILENLIERTLEKVEALLQRENGASNHLPPAEFPSLERKSSTESTTDVSTDSAKSARDLWQSPSSSRGSNGSSEDDGAWDFGREEKGKPRTELRKSNLAKIPLSRSKSWAHFNGNQRPSYLRKADEILRSLLKFHFENPRNQKVSHANDGLKRSTSEIWSASPLRKPETETPIISLPPFRLDQRDEVPHQEVPRRLNIDQPEEDLEMYGSQFMDEPPTPRELRPLSGPHNKFQRSLVGSTLQKESFSEPQVRRSAAIAIPSMNRSTSDASPLLRSRLDMERGGTSDTDLSSSPSSIISLSTSPPLGSSPPDPAAQVARDVILPSWTWHDNTKVSLVSNGTTSSKGVPLPGRHRWLRLYFKYISKEIDLEIERRLKEKEEEAAKSKLLPKRRGLTRTRD